MAKLIDADALKTYIRSQRGRVFSGATYEDMMMTFIDEVEPVEERTAQWRNKMIHVANSAYDAGTKHNAYEREELIDEIRTGDHDA